MFPATLLPVPIRCRIAASRAVIVPNCACPSERGLATAGTVMSWIIHPSYQPLSLLMTNSGEMSVKTSLKARGFVGSVGSPALGSSTTRTGASRAAWTECCARLNDSRGLPFQVTLMDVAEWLRDLGLEQYAPAFRDNDIDGKVLRRLTGDDLRDLGVTSIGHRRRLLDAIATVGDRHRAVEASPAPSQSSLTGSEAERRQLTVMFCDLVGSTALSGRFDPEDLRELIGVYHRCVADTVARFAGFVAKYMGDGVLIYFGYPEAHEDDAERAVRAGLAVIDAVGRLASRGALNVRLGIATGLVVVGDLIGTGAAQERGVVGETPNLAARLLGLAAPDTLVIADSTRRQIGALFEIDDLGQQALAGFSESQRAWRIVGDSGVLSRFEALRSEATPLVGRDEELDLLLSRWQQAKAGKGHVVLVSGEPGIGKSRLSAALSQRIQGDPHIRLRYFCSPYHQDSALYPVRGFVRISQSAGKASRMVTSNSTVFLVDVDNTLLDNDRIQADLRRHLEREFGAECRDRYWTILEALFGEVGYR